MRGILPAILAKTTKLLGSVVQKNFVAPGEFRQKGPNSKRSKRVPPTFEMGSAVTTHTPLNRDKAKSVENIAEGHWLAGTDDHRLLLRGTRKHGIKHASRMPSGPLDVRLGSMAQVRATAPVKGTTGGIWPDFGRSGQHY